MHLNFLLAMYPSYLNHVSNILSYYFLMKSLVFESKNFDESRFSVNRDFRRISIPD